MPVFPTKSGQHYTASNVVRVAASLVGLKQKVCPGCLKAHATDSLDKGATSGADQEL